MIVKLKNKFIKNIDIRKNKIKNIRKMNLEEQKNILYSLNLLLVQGYSLNESIKLVSYRLNLEDYVNQLSEGVKFSSILEKQGFDRDVLLIIQIAEESDQFSNGIERALAILEKKHKNKNAVWEQIKYPLMLGIVMLLGIIFLSKFLIPTFKSVYQSFNLEMGLGLRFTFLIIEGLPKVLFLIGIGIIIFVLYLQSKEAAARLGIFTKYKIFRTQYYKIYNQIFILNFTSLLELGIKLDEIFLILKNQNYNYLLKKESAAIIENLYQGVDLPEALEKQKIYNQNLIEIIADGEQNGTLIPNLRNYLLINEIAAKKRVEKYIFLIQPIFYGIFGIMIIFLYGAMFIPMFAIMDSL